MGEGGEAVKCKNDARMLTGWIGDTKATNEERRSHKVTHPPHLELGPVMRIDPVAELIDIVTHRMIVPPSARALVRMTRFWRALAGNADVRPQRTRNHTFSKREFSPG